MKEEKKKALSPAFPPSVTIRDCGRKRGFAVLYEQKCVVWFFGIFFFFKAVECVISEVSPAIWKQPTQGMEKTLYNCKRQKSLPMLRPCGRSQSLTSPFSGSLENTVFLWPLVKNSLCQISANNSGISFPCLWSVGVLESLACVGRDSLAKIKTVLQSCRGEREKES